MQYCTRVVPVSEEVKLEVSEEEAVEGAPEPEACATPAPVLFALQGKPRCI